MPVGLHPEEHRDGFIDRQGTDPIVLAAPGGEGSNGKGKMRRHAAAKVQQQIAVETALRPGCVEVDLKCGNAGFIGSGEQFIYDDVAVAGSECSSGSSFDANNRNAGGGRGEKEGVTSRLGMNRVVNGNGSVEVGYG